MSFPAVKCRFDHLVVCANTCEQGVDWIYEQSGVSLPFGGKHPLMATHNHLTALSDTAFLEVIAIDPSAKAQRVRWFALDDATQREKLAHRPRLSTWVVATSNLDVALETARQAGIDVGEPVELTRDDLIWRLALRADGSLACEGVFPILIEWPDRINPVLRMQDQGIRLDRLTLNYPDVEFLQQALTAIGVADCASIEKGDAAVMAQLHSPHMEFNL